jgi:hypothetical protein
VRFKFAVRIQINNFIGKESPATLGFATEATFNIYESPRENLSIHG